MYAIEQDASKALSFVRGMVKEKTKYHDKLQYTALTVFWHAVKHGDCTMINLFFNDALEESYKTPFRTWIGVHGKGVMNMKDGLFFVNKGVQDKRDELCTKIETELAAEDAKRFFQAKTQVDQREFQITDVFNRIDSLAKLVTRQIEAGKLSESDEQGKKVIEFVLKMRKEAEKVLPHETKAA